MFNEIPLNCVNSSDLPEDEFTSQQEHVFTPISSLFSPSWGLHSNVLKWQRLVINLMKHEYDLMLG